MNKFDYIKCIVSVINFLTYSDDEYEIEKTFNTDSNLKMMSTLDKYGFGMVSFAEHLSTVPLWNNSPLEFFSDYNKSMLFFTEKLKYFLEQQE